MSDVFQVADYSKVKVPYGAEMIEAGLPPPEKWKGLEIARTIGSKGYTYDSLLEDARKMIGYEAEMPTIKFGKVYDATDIRDFAISHGDDNPLYTDPDYAKNTRYGSMILYPTMRGASMTHACDDWGPYPISSLVSGLSWEYYDIMRVNDKFRYSVKLAQVYEKTGRTGRLGFYITDCASWNQHDKLINTGGGIYIVVGKSGEEEKIAEEASKKGEGMSKTMLYERPTYHYSEEEVQKIVADIKSEERRGATPRYWEDVNVGDKLTPVVKGPLTLMDFESGRESGAGEMGLGFVPSVSLRPTVNPLTGWPYEPVVQHHFDFNLCNRRGFPGPFDLGAQRMQSCFHPIANWMGDDGFLRRMSIQVRKPNYYGDTQWFGGEVVNKYKDKVGEIEYGAIDLIVYVTNQIGENTLPVKATVYLPSRELGEVVLPIPLPQKEEWKHITKRDVKDFIDEVHSGETYFPPLYLFYAREAAGGALRKGWW